MRRFLLFPSLLFALTAVPPLLNQIHAQVQRPNIVFIFADDNFAAKRKHTKELFRRVRQAMPKPSWGTLPHDHYRYVVNVRATYPPDLSF